MIWTGLTVVGDRKKLVEAVKILRKNPGVSADQSDCTGPLPVQSNPAREQQLTAATDIHCAVKTSLRAQVAALSEDNWKYEAEPQPRH